MQSGEKLIVIGGQQRYLRPLLADDDSWYEYEKGVIISLDLTTEKSKTLAEYRSPEEAFAENGSATLFKSATLCNDKLYACTQTEVLIYRIPDFSIETYISLPSFNDVHHVKPSPEGNLLVAVAGLDLVQEISPEGTVIREWNTLGGNPWDAFSKNIDYRPLNTKPHQSHPNFLFHIGDELWSTRFYQKDAICLTRPDRRIEIGVGTPHDGLAQDGFVYFTTVNGNVVIVNCETLKIERTINLNEIHRYGGPLGWCRGIMVQDDKLWVGFSRIRPTKLRENVEWVKRTLKAGIRPVLPEKLRGSSKWQKSMKRQLPSHIACYDLRTEKCLAMIDVEPHGLSAIFSIFVEPSPLRTSVREELETHEVTLP